MNFTRVKNFLFNNIHTALLLVGFLLIDVAITLLTNANYGLLALGVQCIVTALMINQTQKGG